MGKGGRKRGRETSMCKRYTDQFSLTGDLSCNPDMCPDWESNWRPFGSQAGTQSTEPHQPGLYCYFILIFVLNILIKCSHH